MLPDIRVVTIAVISTFLFAVTVGFYTSSRLANERKPRPESLAAIEENPLNRIALNWPEPVQPPQNPLDLDFAVTAKVLRNPVRDVTDEVAVNPPAPESKVAAAPPVVNQNATPDSPALDLPKIDVLKVETPSIEVPKVDLPKPDIARIETPGIETPGIEAPQIETSKVERVAPAAPAVKPEEEIPTASVVEAPRSNAPSAAPANQTANQSANHPASPPVEAEKPVPATPQRAASLPDPDSEEARLEAISEATPKVRPKAAKKAAKKKAKKAAKPAPRPRPRTVVTTAPSNSLFPFFGLQR